MVRVDEETEGWEDSQGYRREGVKDGRMVSGSVGKDRRMA